MTKHQNTYTSNAGGHLGWGSDLIVAVKFDNTLVVRASRIMSKAMKQRWTTLYFGELCSHRR
jgi:hypothetical protein